MDTKFTPGPWKLDQRSGCVAVYPASDEEHTCLSGAEHWAIHYSDKGAEYNGTYWEMDKEAKANARLIAKAPELLEALDRAVVTIHKYVYEHAVHTWATPDVALQHADAIVKEYNAIIAEAKGL